MCFVVFCCCCGCFVFLWLFWIFSVCVCVCFCVFFSLLWFFLLRFLRVMRRLVRRFLRLSVCNVMLLRSLLVISKVFVFFFILMWFCYMDCFFWWCCFKFFLWVVCGLRLGIVSFCCLWVVFLWGLWSIWVCLWLSWKRFGEVKRFGVC